DALNDTEREFLARSVAHRDAEVEAERRRTRVLRRLVGALTATAVIALVLVIVATAAGISAHRTRRRPARTRRRDVAPDRDRLVAVVGHRTRCRRPTRLGRLPGRRHRGGALGTAGHHRCTYPRASGRTGRPPPGTQ